jgi:flavin reductase (DIM6/NTAB) family NADH-FMN oxidoreductase RutF
VREVVDLRRAIDEVGPGRFLVTAAHDGQDNVQRSFRVMALSEEPEPRIGVALLAHYPISELIRRSGELVVNVAGPKHIPRPRPPRAARPAVEDEFAAIGAVRTPALRVGAPLIEDCAAYLECALEQEVVVQDRSLFICRVLVCQVDAAILPVVRVRGRDLDPTPYLAG